jgi:hypothetical protein
MIAKTGYMNTTIWYWWYKIYNLYNMSEF